MMVSPSWADKGTVCTREHPEPASRDTRSRMEIGLIVMIYNPFVLIVMTFYVELLFHATNCEIFTAAMQRYYTFQVLAVYAGIFNILSAIIL